MDELKKAQSEYLRRLADPSYVAPDILRSRRGSTSSRINEVPTKEQDYNPKSNVEIVSFANQQDPQSVTRQDENYYQQPAVPVKKSPSESSYIAELAKSMNIPITNGLPTLDPVKEKFFNNAVDKSIEGASLTNEEINMLNLMLGPNWEK